MEATPAPKITGLVLAAGAGTRSGSPKVLRRTESGEPWVARAVHRLVEAGCDPVLVVLGAGAEAAFPLVPQAEHVGIGVIVAQNWSLGLHASLQAGLQAFARVNREAVLISLVDLPGMTSEVPRRVIEAGPVDRDTLRRAVFDGRPGHPVLIGRGHLGALAAALEGDRGAGPYLAAHGAAEVECGDLWDGADIDT